ncbi:class C beta-lactamase [Mitsuaria sp. GD03876]|uniref:class C beta-lactamase n=1 Tax=Mitsuaria sp. GD03876 TaxID=2975399 RepID=UPI00244CA8C9|nr:class C beta-lactamase [Mitsuaria sp. GD03876]MDH0867932.1 beta-lactamase [Mitsuaria sp. GD03876]
MHWIPRAIARGVALATAGLSVLGAHAAPAAPAAGASDPAPDLAAIRAVVDAAIRPAMARNDIPGMAVGVTVGGQSYVFNYGVASRQASDPVDDKTLFEIGSVSKTFAATLATKAVAEGKLSLSASPGRYLPALKGRPIDRTTLLQLGTYTAGGLPLQVPEQIKDEAAMRRYLQHWKPAYTPGSKRQYSNPSIGLFGRATAAALGRGYADAVQGDLLPRLGLRDTYIRMPAAAMADYAWGHDKDQAVRVTPDVYDAEAYGIKTTAADLLRFVRLNIDPSGLDADTRAAVEGTQVGYFQIDGMTQGLGWEQYPWPVPLPQLQAGNALARVVSNAVPVRHAAPGPRLFNKTGSTRGFGAYVAFVPARGIGVVILANRSWPIPERVNAGYEILQRLEKQPAP